MQLSNILIGALATIAAASPVLLESRVRDPDHLATGPLTGNPRGKKVADASDIYVAE